MTLLTIGGHDPSSGAGVTADLAVFRAHGYFGVSCITALTAQSTVGVAAVEAVSGEFLALALRVLEEDLPVAGIKIGMLGTREAVETVAAYLGARRAGGRRVPVVLDPVLRASSGAELLTAEGLEAMRRELLPLVDWATPNVAELGVLGGTTVVGDEERVRAAEALAERFAGLGVVVTGGDGQRADDLILADGRVEWLRGERVESRSTHGTGCAFASAMLCGLVGGRGGVIAAREAKAYVTEAIRRAEQMGRGRGPMNLEWRRG